MMIPTSITAIIELNANPAMRRISSGVALTLVHRGQSCPAIVTWNGAGLESPGESALATISVLEPDATAEDYSAWSDWIGSIKPGTKFELRYQVVVATGEAVDQE